MPIDRIKLPDNTVHELRDPRVGNARIFYGTCASAAAAVEKVVVCPDFTASELVKGAAILVTFDNTSTAAVADVTMNVNSTGAFKINKIYNNAYGNLTYPGDLRANMTHLFVFSGGSTWIVCGLDYNANTTYSAMTQAQADAGTSTTGYRISPAVLQTKILNMLEANQADWEETDTESPSYIQNKPDIADITPELKEDQTFTTRSTGGNATASKITKIKGNTLVWNQVFMRGQISGRQTWDGNGVGTIAAGTNSSAIIWYNQTSNSVWGPLISGNKYLVKMTFISGSVSSGSFYVEMYNFGVSMPRLVIDDSSEVGQTSSAIFSYNGTGYVLTCIAANSVLDTDVKFGISIINLTQMFGYGNEPATVEDFEAFYPLGRYDYNYGYTDGTLINNSASGLRTTDANDNVIGTLPLNLTTITGKLNGTGESVVVFPEGLRSAGTKYDEISADGKTAIVRIEKVVLTGNEGYSMASTDYIGDNSADVYTGARSGTGNRDVCGNIFYTRSDSAIWFSDLPYAIRANSGNQIHFRIPNSVTGITKGSETTASAIAKVKSYIQGEYENETPIIIYRPLATPLVYTLDAPVSLGYKCDPGGKEIRLPVDTASDVSAPFRADIQYGVNGGDLIDIINSKQDALASGINIKTVNNQTLLGSGNLQIDGLKVLTLPLFLEDFGNKILISETKAGAATTLGITEAQLDSLINCEYDCLNLTILGNSILAYKVIDLHSFSSVAYTLYFSDPLEPQSLAIYYDEEAETPGYYYDYNHMRQDISGKENVSNKVTSLSSSSTDVQYPSAKCVYDELAEKVGSETINNIVELTEEEYDELETKESDTMYIVTDSEVSSDVVGIADFEQTQTSTEDNGINVWTVTLTNNQTFQLAVRNGSQGNSGYTGAAGELEVVNNLTDGGSSSALSAEQGKRLGYQTFGGDIIETLTLADVKAKGVYTSYSVSGGTRAVYYMPLQLANPVDFSFTASVSSDSTIKLGVQTRYTGNGTSMTVGYDSGWITPGSTFTATKADFTAAQISDTFYLWICATYNDTGTGAPTEQEFADYVTFSMTLNHGSTDGTVNVIEEEKDIYEYVITPSTSSTRSYVVPFNLYAGHTYRIRISTNGYTVYSNQNWSFAVTALNSTDTTDEVGVLVGMSRTVYNGSDIDVYYHANVNSPYLRFYVARAATAGTGIKYRLTEVKKHITASAADDVVALAPSLRKAIESLGGVYDESTRTWSYYRTTGLTNEEMIYAYNASLGFGRGDRYRKWFNGMVSLKAALSMNLGHYNRDSADLTQTFYKCSSLQEVLTREDDAPTTIYAFNVKSMQRGFHSCTSLKWINARMSVNPITAATDVLDAFHQCNVLEYVMLYKLRVSISFADSPNLSKESILYMISNNAATSAITITLHATAYAMATADADITAALEEHPLVSLASA